MLKKVRSGDFTRAWGISPKQGAGSRYFAMPGVSARLKSRLRAALVNTLVWDDACLQRSHLVYYGSCGLNRSLGAVEVWM